MSIRSQTIDGTDCLVRGVPQCPAVSRGVTDVCTSFQCVSDVLRMPAQCVKCVLMCHAKSFHVFHVSHACARVCTVWQVCHKCVHMCLAVLVDVLLCAQCVSLTCTVCPVYYCVSRHMWRCVAMCVRSVRMCVYVTLLTDSSVSASGELTDASYDVICV